LADKSPALGGIKADGVLEQDLLGTDWGKNVAMGAYGDYSDDGNAFQYVRWDYGKLTKVNPERPLFPNLPNPSIITHVGFGGYGRVITRLVKKHEKTRISKAIVRITLMDSTAKVYHDAKPIDIPFYRYSEKEGKYLFATFVHSVDKDYNPEKHGRLVLFSKNPDDQGIHGNIIVIHVKKESDRFKYEVK